MAMSLTWGSALSAWLAAPVPRPPQPMSPTRRTALPAACTLATLPQGVARAAPATAEAFKKSRRDDGFRWSWFKVVSCAGQGGEERDVVIGSVGISKRKAILLGT